MAIDWEAVSAVGQVAGAVGTAAAFGATYWLLRVERGRDKAAQDRLIQGQAERVAAWPTAVRSNPIDPESKPVWGVTIRNASDLPIYQVQVVHRPTSTGGANVVVYEVIPPGDWLVSGKFLYPKPTSYDIGITERAMPARGFMTYLRFTDAAGTQWWRNERGELSPVTRETRQKPPKPPKKRSRSPKIDR